MDEQQPVGGFVVGNLISTGRIEIADVSLEPKAARVASKLRLRPNPKVATGGRTSSYRISGTVSYGNVDSLGAATVAAMISGSAPGRLAVTAVTQGAHGSVANIAPGSSSLGMMRPLIASTSSAFARRPFWKATESDWPPITT